MSTTLKFGSWRDWASMARLPNIPTVWSNVFTGWVLACAGFSAHEDRHDFALDALAGTLLYAGGTILNDVNDLKFDRLHRPERPIPSGRISRNLACFTAFVILIAGMVSSILADNGIGVIIFLLILIYTKVHKPFPLIGGVFMGLCRMLLGLAAQPSIQNESWCYDWRCDAVIYYWAITLFLYVCAISWIATGESVVWRRKTVVGMLTALPLLDAGFLLFAGERNMVAVPLACFTLAWYLRKVASPT